MTEQQPSASIHHADRLLDSGTSVTWPVRVEAIKKFAAATKNHHAAHWDPDAAQEWGFGDVVAPPAFSLVHLDRLRRDAVALHTRDVPDLRILHTDQTVDFYEPLMAGDRLLCRVHAESFRYFADYRVLCLRTALIDEWGRTLQCDRTTMLARASGGPAAGAQHFPESSVAQRTPTRPAIPRRYPNTTLDFESLAVDAELPVRTYDVAGAYPLVTDPVDAAAFRALDLGYLTGYLTDWIGDPGALSRLRAQRAPGIHHPGCAARRNLRLAIRGRITALDIERRRATVTIDMRAEGRRVFGYAAADIDFTV